jgi:putative endonuclease
VRTLAQEIGFRAEELVAERLRQAGWTILGRNLRVGRAEIDILAVDPGPEGPESSKVERRGALVAVEVRWRRRRDFGLAEETVDRAKLARVRAAAITLRARGRDPGLTVPGLTVPGLPVRVDLVAVEPGGIVRHHRAVG